MTKIMMTTMIMMMARTRMTIVVKRKESAEVRGVTEW
jgi:hypothetical protein